MNFDFKGKTYEITIGSDVQRDGMYVEIDAPDGDNPILDIFYSDQTDEMVFTAFVQDIPLEVVEKAIAVARERLPPVAR